MLTEPAQLDLLQMDVTGFSPGHTHARERAISKSKYISGLQCHKLIWHQYNAKDLIPAADDAQQAIFDQGHEVGRRAHQLYPNGIYEAPFLGAGVYAQVDILVPTGDGRWDIVEVKSSTSVKDVHLDDVAVQRYAAESAGTRIRNCYVAHIDRDYVRSGDINNTALFRIVDITADVADRLPDVPGRIEVLSSVIRQPESPEIAAGRQCTKPHSCPMIPVCWPGGQIPKVVRGAERQAIHEEAVSSQSPRVDETRVRAFVDGLTYPVFFLDFETFGTAIPLLDGTRPYQQVPFQFSLHIRREPGGELTHHGFLADGVVDPRPQLLQWMREWLEDSGSIVVYFAGFETGRLAELARDFPAYAPWIDSVVARVVDLHAPFKAFDVYHPLQNGSTSIKAVLPALTGSGYEGMAIADGGTASQSFLRIAFGDAPVDEVAQVREDLEAYCRLDTLAMVRILDAMEASTPSSEAGSSDAATPMPNPR